MKILDRILHVVIVAQNCLILYDMFFRQQGISWPKVGFLFLSISLLFLLWFIERKGTPARSLKSNDSPGETDWRKLYLEANEGRTKCVTELAAVKNHLDQIRSAQKPLPAHPLPRLREKIALSCTEWQAFLNKHGDQVRTNKRPEESAEQHMARLSSPELKALRVKFSGEYNRLYFQQLVDLQNEIKQFTGIIDHDLERAINSSKVGGDSADQLAEAIRKFWEIALRVNC